MLNMINNKSNENTQTHLWMINQKQNKNKWNQTLAKQNQNTQNQTDYIRNEVLQTIVIKTN